MSTVGNAGQNLTLDTLLDCLTDGSRRRILAALREHAESMTERELATELVAAERGHSADDPALEAIRAIRSPLRHVHLPKLEDVGLVTWNETDETVALSDHPIHDNPQFQQIVEAEDGGRDTGIALLANDRRRIVLAVLESSNDPLARTDLAREVTARESDGDPTTEPVDAVAAELHHVHLPALEQAGLVEYDVGDGTVVSRDYSELPGIESLLRPNL